MLSGEFMSRLEQLNVPSMGTEAMGPLLYALVRFTQSRRILEVGAGYTSFFLLKALADNEADRRKHERLFRWLHEDYAGRPDELSRRSGDAAPLKRSEYYLDAELPEAQLTVIDSLQNPGSSADLVRAKAEHFGYAPRLEQYASDFRDCVGAIREHVESFDLVWFDCGYYEDYRDFIELYWDLVDPDGGLLLLHSTLTNTTCRVVLEEFKRRQRGAEFNDFEVLSLLEPHKSSQNSVTLIRKTSAFVPPDYTVYP